MRNVRLLPLSLALIAVAPGCFAA
ncbi:MAG: hypothetical protein QOG58_1075, partial [Caballeronia sp.]|nr:hypothetical protein [Caballeronia sp.]